jgi:hypothetical protein
MSIFSPTTVAEVKKAGWYFLPFLISPPILLVFYWWRVYFPSSTHVNAAALGAVLGLPATYLMFRRAKRLAQLGIHPYFHARTYITWKQYLGGWCALFLLLYGWILVATTLSLGVSGNQTVELPFVVSQAKACTRKCLGCPFEVNFENWPGLAHTNLCAGALQPPPQIGEKLVIKGYLSPYAIYVETLLRPNAG